METYLDGAQKDIWYVQFTTVIATLLDWSMEKKLSICVIIDYYYLIILGESIRIDASMESQRYVGHPVWWAEMTYWHN